MIIIVLHKVKRRLMQILRMLFALSILVLLAAHLWGVIKSIDLPNHKNEHKPHGNPMKVEQSVPVTQPEEGEEQNFLDYLLQKLTDYHHGK